MKKVFAIDGRQLMGKMGGVQRYISEVVKELDKIVKPGEVEIIIPKNGIIKEKYNNIRIVKSGILKGLLWEQISFPLYLFTHRRWGIWMCSIVSMLYPRGISVVHDIMPVKYPEVGQSFNNFFSKKILFLNYKIACKKSNCLVTVSNTSKRDIMQIYGRKENRICVIGNAWQHMSRIIADDSWMKRFPQVKKGEYYFSLSANRKQKNFRWISEIAKKNSDSLFLIAGTIEEWQKNEQIIAPNIIQLGFVSDEEIKSLMANCKAFLFPSLYEGFGIPPMEALSTGAKIVIARSSCLPEIYGDSAYYIDPYDYDVDLNMLLSTDVSPASDCLDRYGWDISAKKFYRLMKKYNRIYEN